MGRGDARTMIFLIVTGVLLLLCGFGLAVVRLIEGREEIGPDDNPSPPPNRSVAEHLAFGFLCGIALTGLAGQACIALRMRLTGTWWAGMFGTAAAVTLAAIILDLPRLKTRWRRFRTNPAGLFPRSPIALAFMILTLAALYWSFLQAEGLPIVGWDPLSFWYLKTKILLHEGTVFCPDFLDPGRLHAHTDYPILVNIVESGICKAIGMYRETPLKVFLAAWEAACLVIAGTAMARRRGKTAGWVAVVLIALLPALTDFDTTGAVSGYRDAPLALGILAAASMIVDRFETPKFRRGDLARFALLLALLIGTKREGTVWAALLGLAAVGAVWRRSSQPGAAKDLFPTRRDRAATAHAGAAGKIDPTPPSPAGVPLPVTPTHQVESPLPSPARWRRTFLALLFYLAIPFALMAPWFSLRAQMPYPRSEQFTKVMEQQRWDVTGQRATVVTRELRNELFLRVQKWGVLWWVFAAVGLWRWRFWSSRERLLALLIPAGWGMASMGFVFTPWGSPMTHMSVSIDRLVLQGALLAMWLLVLNLARSPHSDPHTVEGFSDS